MSYKKKKIIAYFIPLFVGAVFLMTYQIAQAQTSNLLSIGNMESGGWTVKNLDSNALLSYEANAGINNSKALKLKATNVGANSYYVAMASGEEIRLLKNEYYTVSFWAKTTDTPGIELKPWVQINDASINYPFSYLKSEFLTKNYVQYSYTFKHDLQTSNKVVFKYRVYSPGTILIDNVKLGPASQADIKELTEGDPNPIYKITLTQNNQSKEIPVYKSNCPNYVPGYMDMQEKDNIPFSIFHGRSVSWTNFSFEGSIDVEVEVLNQTKVPVVGQQVEVWPSRHKIIPQVNGNKINFTLDKPGQFSVEVGQNGYKNGLVIFANPLETDIPDINDPSYLVLEPGGPTLKPTDIPKNYSGLYFKKGEHNIDIFNIPEHVRNIYLADSAWVYGALIGEHGKGKKIFGRGILSQAKINYRAAHGIDIATDSATVDGIVVADIKRFTVRLRASYNTIDWVKVIGGWAYNADGITAYANSTVSNCFIWANDDAIKVYLSNITWSDIVVWQLNNGGVIQISWGRTEAHNCTISRVDILRAEWVKAGFNAALFSCVGNHYQEPDRFSIQNNWVIEDIVTETPIPLIFGLNPHKHSVNHIRNFTLKNWNVKMTSNPLFKNRIIAGHPNTKIDGFIFENFVFNGQLLTQQNWKQVLDIETSGFATPTVLSTPSGVDKTTKSEYKTYPNPVSHTLNIDNAEEDSNLKVYDMNARLSLTGQGKQLNVSLLQSGQYLLSVNDKPECIFIKQ